jgi:lysylphosphatidylglycerol synthetase-like protein (DUF2156 family)
VKRVDEKFPETVYYYERYRIILPVGCDIADCELQVVCPSTEFTEPTVRWGCSLLLSRGALVIWWTTLVPCELEARAEVVWGFRSRYHSVWSRCLCALILFFLLSFSRYVSTLATDCCFRHCAVIRLHRDSLQVVASIVRFTEQEEYVRLLMFSEVQSNIILCGVWNKNITFEGTWQKVWCEGATLRNTTDLIPKCTVRVLLNIT